jgi:PTH1 family peptidyl-tRNA hydrolase
MILIVGLGNPEKKYDGTRHNVGFAALDYFAKEIGAEFKMSEKFNAEIAEATVQFDTKRVRVMLAKPQTYMNLSGESVAKIVNFYKFRTEDQVWVVHDDLDIEIGAIRIRLKGSSAGQKGIGSIIERLGTDCFVRFRVGIKPAEGQTKPAEQFVLEKFRPEEKKTIEQEIKELTKIIIDSMDKGIINTSL